jgi:hypothetical protein
MSVQPDSTINNALSQSPNYQRQHSQKSKNRREISKLEWQLNNVNLRKKQRSCALNKRRINF